MMGDFIKLLVAFLVQNPSLFAKPQHHMKRFIVTAVCLILLCVAFVFGVSTLYAFLESLAFAEWVVRFMMMCFFLALGGVLFFMQRWVLVKEKEHEQSLLDLEKLLALWHAFQEGYRTPPHPPSKPDK